MKSIIIFIIVIFYFSSQSRAQWQSIAPNLIGQGPYGNRGAMATANGVAWAGLHQLFKSTDKGLSWQNVSFPLPGSNFIQYISFFDAKSGIVSTDAGLFVTHDQGTTWKAFFQNEDIWAGIFSGSSNTFVIGDATVHSARFTQDDGVTWNTQALGYSPKDFYSSSPGNVIAFVEKTTSSFIAVTSDFGNTWVNQGGTMEPDAHSFGVVPCDGKIIFGINEEGGNYTQDNYLSEVYMSRDGGASFKSIFNYPTATLSGCIAITPGVIYIPARSMGILESTDSGATWMTATGPNLPIDCHDIISIEDTILLAADNNGTIWRNIDPRAAAISSVPTGTLSVSPTALQFPDSISPCGSPVQKTIFIGRGCNSPSITSITYSGNKDSDYFKLIGKSSDDSLIISFFPDSARSYTANIDLHLNTGSKITVPLQGFGKNPQVLDLSSLNIQSTIIGETIRIPIISTPKVNYGGLDLSVHFDTSMLIYQGTHNFFNNTDQTTDKSIGFARVHFDEGLVQTAGDTIGYVEFLIFPTHTPCTTVTFDSISIANSKGLICGLAEPSFSSQICYNIGCETAILSNYLRYNRLPLISIYPNPSSGFAAIHSNVNLGNVMISVFDQAGRVQLEEQDVLSPLHQSNIKVQELPTGIYQVCIESGEFRRSVPLVILH